MGSDHGLQSGPASIENASYVGVEEQSNNIDSLEVLSSSGGTTHELQSATEALTRVELDLACSSEKLINLNVLVMHVASREGDFQAFALEEEPPVNISAEKALEFDLLYGFLDSELREVKDFLSVLQTEIISYRGTLNSFKQDGDALKEAEEKLQVCEETLKQLFEQVADVYVQSVNLQRILLDSSGDGNWKDDDKGLAGLGNGHLPDSNAKIRMQTAEQQRNILRMLEKSLAREIDLENKLTESRQTKEDLKLQVQREVICMEEEAEDMWGRLFEAENNAEILLSFSRELFQQVQSTQIHLKGSVRRQGELTSKVKDLDKKLKQKESALQFSESFRIELEKKVCSLELKLVQFESQSYSMNDSPEQNKNLMMRESETEKRAVSAETECRILKEFNMELNKDLSQLKISIACANERIEKLENQLKDCKIKMLHAEASVEASQEREHMLDCTIKDMDDLIKDLKAKVAMAENQMDSAEEKCIILSESNAELNEEVNFLGHRVEHLEKSLFQVDEANKETAKDIRVRSKFIADLVMQLALEREHLHKQISSLAKEKKVQLKHTSKIGSCDVLTLSDIGIKDGFPEKEKDDETKGTSSLRYEVENAIKEHENSMPKDNTVRNIEARQLNFKQILLVLLILLIPPFAAFLFASKV